MSSAFIGYAHANPINMAICIINQKAHVSFANGISLKITKYTIAIYPYIPTCQESNEKKSALNARMSPAATDIFSISLIA